ncbi:MAG: TrmB family transcriptional regulator [Spirochaetales bacterium]|nr:TrmB family transcriptional regulator [Spirochaetales bacterium]
MDKDKLLNIFKQLGFTEYEAKVYLSLLGNHPASAYTISQSSGVPHSRVYDILRRLTEKEYAQAVGENPKRYSPLSPENLIRFLNKRNTDLTDELDEELKKTAFNSDFDPVWNLKDGEEAFRTTRELISAACEKIWIGLWESDLPQVEDELRKAEGRGVDILILLYGDKKLDYGRVYHHSVYQFDPGIRRSLDCVVDSNACVSGLLGSATQASQIVWTNNAGLIHSIEGYIMHDFYIAEIQSVYGDDFNKKFGDNLIKLRKNFSF